MNPAALVFPFVRPRYYLTLLTEVIYRPIFVFLRSLLRVVTVFTFESLRGASHI